MSGFADPAEPQMGLLRWLSLSVASLLVALGRARMETWSQLRTAVLGEDADDAGTWGGHVTAWALPRDPSAPATARRLARAQLADWGIDQPVSVVELLVSELVTNALRHACGPIGMALHVRDGLLRCEVEDAEPTPPHLCHAGESDEGGRGLHLVDVLSRRWGADRTATGKTVWFELSLDDASADDAAWYFGRRVLPDL